KYSGGGWYNGLGFGEVSGDQLTMFLGGETDTFAELKKTMEPLLLPPGRFLVPFGQMLPERWAGGFSADGYASFWVTDKAHMVEPGAGIDGLKLISPGVPVIREMVVVPFWVAVFPGEPTKDMAAKAGRVEQAIRVHLSTLAPAGTKALAWSSFEAEV